MMNYNDDMMNNAIDTTGTNDKSWLQHKNWWNLKENIWPW